MHRLIKAELFKLVRSRSFKVLCILSAVAVVILMGATLGLTEEVLLNSLGDMPPEQQQIFMQQIESITTNSGLVEAGRIGITIVGIKDLFNMTTLEIFHASFGQGIIEILIAILVASIFAKEYSEGTIKNTLAYGKKRGHFYLAKFIAITIGVSIIMTIMVGGATIIQIVLKGWGQPFEMAHIIEMISVFIGSIIVNAATVAVVMLVASLVKSSGATIGIVVSAFVVLPMILGFLYGNIEGFDKIYELTLFYNAALVKAINATATDMLRAVTIGIVTMIVALTTGIKIFKIQDIK